MTRPVGFIRIGPYTKVEYFLFHAHRNSTAIRQRATRIKLFLCDVGGMLTDGPIWRCPTSLGNTW
jgi:hypothetical protein